MLIDLHRLLALFYLDSPVFNSQLDLLMEDFALICIVRIGIVPLAVLFILQLFSRWNIMIRGKLNLLLPQQEN
jgi:hypothetical protein